MTDEQRLDYQLAIQKGALIANVSPDNFQRQLDEWTSWHVGSWRSYWYALAIAIREGSGTPTEEWKLMADAEERLRTLLGLRSAE